MNAMSRNALKAYSQVSIDGTVAQASSHKLILMLFEGALLSIAVARGHMHRQELAAKGMAISKAIAIIDEGLRVSLDLRTGGELAQKLDALYEYMNYRLLLANLHNDIEPLDEVGKLLGDLQEAWDSIGKPQTGQAGPKQGPD